MTCTFEKLGPEHRDGVIGIFNHYIRTGTAAFREEVVGEDYYLKFLEVAAAHSGYAIRDERGRVAGFCLLKPHKPLSTFAETAELMYFLGPEHTGKGIGAQALQRLEDEARKSGIKNLLASISSENSGSIEFHRQHGFVEYGRLKDIGKKFGRTFSVVWMGKAIA